jgi:hypothetical protein
MSTGRVLEEVIRTVPMPRLFNQFIISTGKFKLLKSDATFLQNSC